MPRPHISMRKVRDVLRLSLHESLSLREVAASLQIPFTTVADHVRRAKAAGLTWPLPEDLDDDALEARLFASKAPSTDPRPVPDWRQVHLELRRPHVTLMLLWLEHKEAFPDGHAYSQFCELYRRWRRHVDVVMRQEHKAGEKLFVDFPGPGDPHLRLEDRGRGVRGGAIRGRTRGQQLPLRRGLALARAAALGHRARARLRSVGRLSTHRGVRQPSLGGDAPAPLRARRQRHLSGDGRSLRGGHHAGP